MDLFSRDNRLLVLGRTARLRLPRWLERFYPLLALLYAPIALFVLAIPTLPLQVQFLAGGKPTVPPAVFLAMQLILSFGGVYLMVALWLRLMERRPYWTLGLERGQALRQYLRGLGAGLLLFFAAVTLFALPGYVAVEPAGLRPQGLAALGGVALVLLGWIVQGGAEEVLTRGFLVQAIGVRWGRFAGITLSSLLFALLHLLNPNVSAIAFGNLALFGLFACCYALREQGLWGVCGMHSAWNWAQGNLLGFEVSGADVQTGTLLNLREAGPDWLTGGLFGPEGGLAVTVMLLLASAALVFVRPRR